MPPCTKPITAPSETYRAATAASGSQGEGGRAEVERVVMSELPAHADAGQPFLAKTHGTDRRPPALAGDQAGSVKLSLTSAARAPTCCQTI
ncbi:hypothetical protein G6F65_023034 [Rhizopus arrhizus]|nr:hypothetical protein G6F65_023034 [Rhizopus arrhizus]